MPVEKAKLISKCLETAILLEVSANKPGNVNLTVGFEGTRVEHFLASAVAAAPMFEEAAQRGIATREGKLKPSEVGVGERIKKCVADIAAWQSGGNTLLGTVLLFIPLAVAGGRTPMNRKGEFDLTKVRKNLKAVIESTTTVDAVNVYDAISIANPSGLNDAPDLSVTSADSKARLIKENVTLFKVFQIAEGYDDICYEWVHNYPVTFDVAYPYLLDQLNGKRRGLTTAIVHTFLKVLAERPDTFISRKVGVNEARKVSDEASEVLKLGGVETQKGRERIVQFDRWLRERGNNYNPGTTADITSATLALLTLSGYRP